MGTFVLPPPSFVLKADDEEFPVPAHLAHAAAGGLSLEAVGGHAADLTHPQDLRLGDGAADQWRAEQHAVGIAPAFAQRTRDGLDFRKFRHLIPS
jgi:hypothetical protein